MVEARGSLGKLRGRKAMIRNQRRSTDGRSLHVTTRLGKPGRLMGEILFTVEAGPLKIGGEVLSRHFDNSTCICGHSRGTLTKPPINFGISGVLESVSCIAFAPHA